MQKEKIKNETGN